MTEHRVLGKAEPTSEELAAASDRGFGAVELYLERHHLDRFEDVVDACESASVTVEAVHTPHVTPGEAEYLELTDSLAAEIGAGYVCVHSGGIALKDAVELGEELDWQTPHGYESDPGESLHYIEQNVFNRDVEFVLDTAHVYMGAAAFRRVLRTLLTEPYVNQIGLVHLSDATPTEDGLPFGEGEMDMDWVTRQVKREYDGQVVLEVPRDEQKNALAAWESASE